MRPDRDSFWFKIAADYATMATCPRASIGCVIVSPRTKRQAGAGYNGAPANEAHCTDVGCRFLPGADHCIRATHAEINAAQQVGAEQRDLVAYVVGGREVCSHCARELYAVKWREVASREDAIRERHLTWKRATFPHETIHSAALHLADEADELLRNPASADECADVRLLLWSVEDQLAGFIARSGVDILDAAEQKIAINERRIWADRGDGVFEHVREVTA
jgi:deoxycytidylate deaminase